MNKCYIQCYPDNVLIEAQAVIKKLLGKETLFNSVRNYENG